MKRTSGVCGLLKRQDAISRGYIETRPGRARRLRRATLKYYMYLATDTDFSYGKDKSKWKDSAREGFTRIRRSNK